MNMQKKGQGLPLSTVILAILGILVLVILATPLTSYIAGIFSKTAQGCVAEGGTCFNDIPPQDQKCYFAEGAFGVAGDRELEIPDSDKDETCPIEGSKCCPRGYAVK